MERIIIKAAEARLPKTMCNDIRYAFRTLLRERGFASMAVLSLAIGIGANTAIFSVVNGVLLRPLPYPNPERLYTIREVVPKLAHLYPSLPVNFSHYYEWRTRCSALESIAVMEPSSPNLTGAGEPELLNGALVTGSIFRVLGVSPQLGRGFLEEEDLDGHNQVVVISDSLWRRRFHADLSIIGRKITLSGRPLVVVGVLPRGFQVPERQDLDSKTEVFQPLGYSKGDLEEINGDYNWSAIARLRPGVSPRKALAELNVIQAEISNRIPEKMDLHAKLSALQDDIVAQSRRGLLVLLGAVGAVLLILCVNLANLSLARAAGRARESAIRTAFGAGRARLVRQALTESLVLALAGGGLGIALAAWGVQLLVGAAPLDLPRLGDVHLDARVLGFALLISIVTGVVFGILPALRAGGAHPQEALKSGSCTTTEGRRGVRLRDALVALEAALGAVLLITAGLLTGSFVRLMHVDKGFDIERVLSVHVAMPFTKYPEMAQQAAFFERVLEKARSLPGVLSASFVSALPLQGETWVDVAAAEGDQRPMFERPMVNVRFVSPDYFKTLRIPFREGGPFDDSQRKRKVVIVSQGTARRLWPHQSAVGRRMQHNDTLEEVVGVAADVRSTSLDKRPGADHIRSDLAAPAVVRLAPGAHGDGPARHRCGLARGDTPSGRGCARARDADAAGSDVGFGDAAPLPNDAGAVVRRRGAGLGRLRHLWRGLVFGGAAPHGNGHPHGVGRGHGRPAADGVVARDSSGGGGAGGGRRGRAGGRPDLEQPAVPGERAGSVDHRRGGACNVGGVRGGGAGAGAPGDTGGSDEGAAVRINVDAILGGE